MHHIIEIIAPYISATLELVGIFIIVYTAIVAFVRLILTKMDVSQENIKLYLARGLAFSLEFKLAAEIIKTVTVRTLQEFLVLAAIVVLRVVMTFVIEWEIQRSS